MVDLLNRIQNFIDEYSRYFILGWATFIGVAVRLIFESKKTRVTIWLFVSRYTVAVFFGWFLATWLKGEPALDKWYGPIIAASAVVSYEIVGIFINEVPSMVSGYFKRKFESLEKKEEL